MSSDVAVPAAWAGYRTALESWRLLRRLRGIRVRTEGTEFIPSAGTTLFAMTHYGHLCLAPVFETVWSTARRPVITWGNAAMLAKPPVNLLGAMIRAIPAARGGAAVGGVDAPTRDAAARGHLLGAHPEGGINWAFDPVLPRAGAIVMAQRIGIPLTPVVIVGMHRLSTLHRMPAVVGRPFDVHVAFGAPQTVEADEDVDHARARLLEAWREIDRATWDRYLAGQSPRDGDWWLPARLGGGAPPPVEIAGKVGQWPPKPQEH